MAPRWYGLSDTRLTPPPSSPAQLTDQAINLDKLHQAWHVTPALSKELEENGIVFAKGRWTTHEKAKLKANIDKFCADNNITDLTSLIFPEEGESGRRKRTSEGQKELYKAAAAGIMRPIFNVYRQVLRMYDASANQGRFSQEDVRTLACLPAPRHRTTGASPSAAGISGLRSIPLHPLSLPLCSRVAAHDAEQGADAPAEDTQL